jgi:hypothetical protein
MHSFLSLPIFFILFRKIRREARERIPGLIQAVLLLEGVRTCHTLSLWTDDNAIRDFGSHIHSHVPAARWAFSRLFFNHGLRRAEIFSAQWKLWAVGHNLNWPGVNLRDFIAMLPDKPARQEVAEEKV